jgi:hypothetical protein
MEGVERDIVQLTRCSGFEVCIKAPPISDVQQQMSRSSP